MDAIFQLDVISKIISCSNVDELTTHQTHILRVYKTVIMFYEYLELNDAIKNKVIEISFWEKIRPYEIDAMIKSRYSHIPSELLHIHLQQKNAVLPHQKGSKMYARIIDAILDKFSHKMPVIIADMGCGHGELRTKIAELYPKWYVYPIDHVKYNDHTLNMNMKNVCIKSNICHVVLFNKSLWGNNQDYNDYVDEAHRLLSTNGYLIVCDKETKVKKFIEKTTLSNKFITENYVTDSFTTSKNKKYVLVFFQKNIEKNFGRSSLSATTDILRDIKLMQRGRKRTLSVLSKNNRRVGMDIVKSNSVNYINVEDNKSGSISYEKLKN